MAADPRLVERLRALLADEPSLEEKRMFGGVGFMVEGALAIAAMGGGGLLARVGREAVDELIGPGVEQMAMNGRVMTGWLRVLPEAVEADEDLAAWARRCRDFVATLD